MIAVQILSEGWNVPTVDETNAIDAVFSGIAPGTIGPNPTQMIAGTSVNDTNSDDNVENVTSTGFEATQIAYGGNCQPQCQIQVH